MGNTRYIVRHVNYFRGMVGHEFTLVFESEIKDIERTDREWYKQLERPDFIGLISKAPKTEWAGSIPLPEDKDGLSYVPASPSKTVAAELVRVEAASLKAEAAREAWDSAYALEKALKSHDWHAHYSDDNSVFFASEQHWDKIKGLLAQVSPEVGQALVAKYKPS